MSAEPAKSKPKPKVKLDKYVDAVYRGVHSGANFSSDPSGAEKKEVRRVAAPKLPTQIG